MNCWRGGIKYNSCSGKQGRNECIKRENGERSGEPDSCAEREFEEGDKWEEASGNIFEMMREMRWSEVKCKDSRANGQEVMGCSDSHWQRYGSGEAENEDAKRSE